jgi:hypothetical protein
MGGMANQRQFSNDPIESSYLLRSCTYVLSIGFPERQPLPSRAAIFRKSHG